MQHQRQHHFSTRDLVVIAMLSALGGVLSTYVGYLGNLVNRMLGIPFGAGQFMAGLHVLWMVLAHGILMKRGASSLTGWLKGLVEMFMGSTHGAVIVVVSGIQGIVYDAGMASSRRYSLPVSYLSAGLASASNVVVFAVLYLRAVPLPYLLLMFCLAFSSGIIFGGYFGNNTLQDLARLDMVESGEMRHKQNRSRLGRAAAVVFVVLLSIGAVHYFSSVYTLQDGSSCEVMGSVEEPFTYYPEDFAGKLVTIEAELQGSYTYVGPQNYTGVPLGIILSHAQPSASSSVVKVVASDGYSATFSLSDVISDQRTILILEDDSLRLVAGDYDGAYWVKEVVRLVVS